MVEKVVVARAGRAEKGVTRQERMGVDLVDRIAEPLPQREVPAAVQLLLREEPRMVMDAEPVVPRGMNAGPKAARRRRPRQGQQQQRRDAATDRCHPAHGRLFHRLISTKRSPGPRETLGGYGRTRGAETDGRGQSAVGRGGTLADGGSGTRDRRGRNAAADAPQSARTGAVETHDGTTRAAGRG